MTESLPVLLVDDEEILLGFLKTALERGGLDVVTATSGSEALDLLSRQTFSAIVSDLKMPGSIGGEEIFNWVHENRPELSRGFLFITGDVNAPYALDVQKRTGGLFIQKPFRIALFIELIKKIRARSEDNGTVSVGEPSRPQQRHHPREGSKD